jgi:hypothetical protein
MYNSMRFALKGLSAALRADLRRTNVLVQGESLHPLPIVQARTHLPSLECAAEVVLAETKSEYWQRNPGSKERVPLVSKLLGSLLTNEAALGVVYGIQSGEDVYSELEGGGERTG